MPPPGNNRTIEEIMKRSLMHINRSLRLLLALACSTPLARAETASPGKHLFILSGQSNMARLTPENDFIPMVEKAFGKENVIVIKDAHGGKAIDTWYVAAPPAGQESHAGIYYNTLLDKVRAGIADQKIATITFVWMQGESDAVENRGSQYEENLKGLLGMLAQDLKRDDIHLVLGRLNDAHAGDPRYPDWNTVREIQMRIAGSRPRSAWVNTDDLNDAGGGLTDKKKGGVHYTPEGYTLFGQRLAEKAIVLIETADLKNKP